MNKQITILLALFTVSFTLVGCKDSQPEPSKGVEAFYHQKNSTVYTYKQELVKTKYEDCLFAKREDPKKVCHEPDFLKK